MTIGPTGCAWNSKEVTTPKLLPAPRTAQKRSSFSVALALRSWPSAVTMSTESRLSIERPCLRRRWPTPPCSVRPAMPVVETTPPGTASPKSCVSRSQSPQSAPPSRPHRPRRGVDVDAAHLRQVDDEAAVVDRVAGHVVAAALDREQQVLLAREVDGVDDVRGAGALHDQRRLAVDQPVPDRARVVIARIAGCRTAPRTPSTKT